MALEIEKTEIEQIDEDLDSFDQGIKRLRIDHEQYFAGVLKRPPTVLMGKMQKLVVLFASAPPRNTRQKFRFNQLNAKFQMMRQQWGRIQRQIDAGTYKPHRFRAKLHEAERGIDTNTPGTPQAAPAEAEPSKPATGIDRLYDALQKARRKTGEHGDLDRAALASTIRQQSLALKEKYGDAKVRFKVVVEGNKAKVKATVSRA